MIECRQANNLFDAYLNDELSPSLTAELHAHLIACPRCSKATSLLEACGDVIATDPIGPTPSEGFTGRVLAASRDVLSQRALARRWRPVSMWAGVGLAAAAVLTFMVLPLAMNESSGQQSGTLVQGDVVTIDTVKTSKEDGQRAMLQTIFALEEEKALADGQAPGADASDLVGPFPDLGSDESESASTENETGSEDTENPVDDSGQVLEE